MNQTDTQKIKQDDIHLSILKIITSIFLITI